MTDPLNSAMNLVKAKAVDTGAPAADAAKSTAISAIPPDAMATKDKLKNLPVTKDPELLKKQKEAEIQTKKTEAEQLKLQLKDETLEEGKGRLKSFALSLIPFPPKLPLINPKILQAVALAKQAKKLIDERKKVSKENLKKNKEAYEYPLKPPTELPKVPEVPALPTISKTN